MTNDLSPIERAKSVAAHRSCDFVESGMRVGLPPLKLRVSPK